MTTKRTPAVGDMVEFKIGNVWKRGVVRHVYPDSLRIHGYGTRKAWRWPGEAVDGTRRGRPRLPATEKRRAVSLWLSPDERRELEAYAAREGSMLGEAIRDAALRAARWKP